MPDENEIEESDVASDNEYEGRDEQDDGTMMENSMKADGQNGGDARDTKKPKLDPKDPLRPRRKKARRACFACQRAHLTCGDERPCQRCIKRGLADACQDGVRKKAKYLHDAPPEALRPVLGPNYSAGTNGRTPGQMSNSTSTSDASPSGVGNFFPQVNNSPGYMQFQQLQHQQMPPPMQDPLPFMSQQSPISPSFSTNAHHQTAMRTMSNSLAPKMEIQETNPYGGALFDPSNPALFNFDLDSLNFGNHYGAMEFSMLNHMSSGAAETPPQDQSGAMSNHGSSFDATNMYPGAVQFSTHYPSQDPLVSDYGLSRSDSTGKLYQVPQNMFPRAYAIEAGPISNPSPSTDAHASPQSSLVFDSSPKTTFNTASISRQQKRDQLAQNTQAKFPALMAPQKRSRDTSSIYSSVTEPYSYTTGFHALTAFVQRRFSANATLKIAKSLASIRPSFISCTKTLNREDLIFMEKCFQRTLYEYEDFMRDCSTPTLVCRRSGEVAAVNKEFTLLTGWTKNVLLGRETNLNVNTGKNSARSSANPSLQSTGRAGLTTPRLRSLMLEKGQESRPSYVLLAELLDDDSVIEFYEDFAKLAFGDSRGSVTKRCKLLKYQAKELETSDKEDDRGRDRESDKKWEEERRKKDGGVPNAMLSGRVSKIDGEFGIGRLEKDGKLDCSYCWTVKRDVFDIPMLIVMNFLPCI